MDKGIAALGFIIAALTSIVYPELAVSSVAQQNEILPASLVASIGNLIGYALAGYLFIATIKQHREEKAELLSSITAIVKRQNDTSDKMAEAMSDNAKAIGQLTDAIDKIAQK